MILRRRRLDRPGNLIMSSLAASFTPALDQDVQHDPVLVHRAPKPVLHPGDLHRDLIQMPFVASTRQPAADPVGKCLAELEGPLLHGLMADDDAAGGKNLVDMVQAERKAEIEPDDVADDLAGKR